MSQAHRTCEDIRLRLSVSTWIAKEATWTSQNGGVLEWTLHNLLDPSGNSRRKTVFLK